MLDADDFNNWDLISFLNANAFRSLPELLGLREVHLLHPFSFPMYNTGAESAVSILIHRAMANVSLYWSNAVAVLLYDVVFLAALQGLLRLVLADVVLECVAWAGLAMSPVLLTFLALSAFNVQAYATITVALLGCELVLQSRLKSGLALVATGMLCLSQAYPITFFLPLFCAVWVASRAMMHWAERGAWEDGYLRRVALLAAFGVAGVLVVEFASDGVYLTKAFGVVGDGPSTPAAGRSETGLVARMATLLTLAFVPRKVSGNVVPGFAPYFEWLALLLIALHAALFRAKAGWSVDWRRTAVTVAAWAGLVAFGYLPALFGSQVKSQRCFFGDVFLALALARAAGWWLRRGVGSPRGLAGGLLVAMLAADAVYLGSVFGVDHTRDHSPIFDQDVADGIVPRGTIAAIEMMRHQIETEDTGLVVHYTRGRAENSTDPSIFHARFLRHFGDWQGRDDVVFPCKFCNVRYGCPFPEVMGRPCANRCCYEDPLIRLLARPGAKKRVVHLWWFHDSSAHDSPDLARTMKSLARGYRVEDLGWPVTETRWQHFRLTPRGLAATVVRQARPKNRQERQRGVGGREDESFEDGASERARKAA